jgi:hypothetical protein
VGEGAEEEEVEVVGPLPLVEDLAVVAVVGQVVASHQVHLLDVQ